jgi:predicted Zn-dependent protease with MMP-like domain
MTLDQLVLIARQAVEKLPHRLPPDIAQVAAALPVFYEPRPTKELVAEGLEPDVLGLFVGPEHLAVLDDGTPFPSQILIFVENLWDFAGFDAATYRDEVCLTYLHELGHYLGWDEDEIARRGLE